ncbi:MAG: hypothetical protein HUU10_04385 [Bacteroidetes bacterium]|nr:hypothetical protein [Bacteroidota bacterium]
MQILPEDKIDELLQVIDDAISGSVDMEDPTSIRQQIILLSSLAGTSAKTVADSKYHQRQAELRELRALQAEARLDKLAPTTITRIINTKTAEQARRSDLADRLNAALVHALDGYRSSLSFVKAELEHGNR